MTRYVEKKILSVEQSEGVGATVRRSIGTSHVCRTSLDVQQIDRKREIIFRYAISIHF